MGLGLPASLATNFAGFVGAGTTCTFGPLRWLIVDPVSRVTKAGRKKDTEQIP